MSVSTEYPYVSPLGPAVAFAFAPRRVAVTVATSPSTPAGMEPGCLHDDAPMDAFVAGPGLYDDVPG